MNFIKEKCINRVINLSECSLGFNSMIVLADILRKNIEICSRIILTKNDFGDEGIQLLLECLEGNNNIVELNLSSNSLGVNGGKSIFQFLLNQESIVCLDLSSKEGIYRNRVCAEGIKLITKVLKNNFFLEKIDLSSNSIKNEGMKYIVNGLITNESLKYLIIPNNEITEKGILYMESKLKICKLKYLNIGSNPIGNIGIISLGNCIAGDKLAEIISLNASECSIGFEAFYQFIKKICKNHKIQNLIFNKNDLSGKKWDLLEDTFKVLSLKSISLSRCNLGLDMREVSNVFRVNPTLKYLDLSHNKITDENFEVFKSYPKDNLILEELDLSSNYISDKSAIKFFQNLIDNRTLLKINFFDNNLANETANIILDLLKTNIHILNINVNCNNISLRIMNEIKNKIQNNKIIEKVKYIPKLKNELRDLEFNPNEINEIKNKLKYHNIERENLTKKFRKEIKDLQMKKKDI
jgi:Ran GTPase-activating protein (RanGAP) involved in mRNA processing and transport